MNRREFLKQTAALAVGSAAVGGLVVYKGDSTAITYSESFDPADFANPPRNNFRAARISEQRPDGSWITVHRPGADAIGRMVNYGG